MSASDTQTCPHVMSQFATQLDCLKARDEWHVAALTAANAKLEEQAVRLREAERDAAALWKLLDDIDTASDRYKSNYQGLAKYVYKTQRKRFEIMTGEQYDAALAQGRQGGGE